MLKAEFNVFDDNIFTLEQGPDETDNMSSMVIISAAIFEAIQVGKRISNLKL